MHIVLGVCGGIAAYKSVIVLRLFRESGHAVRVIPTQNSLHFVGQATWEALSANSVTTSVFENVEQVAHVRIGQEASLVLVAPATADFLARAAQGQADDLLTSTLLMTTAPIVVAPAMHTEMWLNAAVQANVTTLRDRGWTIIEPAVGRLTGADSGPGRLPEPAQIVVQCLAVLEAQTQADTMAGLRVLVSAGGTREPLDPVRYLGNRSSGKQGLALARSAHARGARVYVLAANIDSSLLDQLPAAIEVSQVETTEELRTATLAAATSADVFISTAAIADYRPTTVSTHKLKKSADAGLTLELEQTPDILREIVDLRQASLLQTSAIVGFAAETDSTATPASELAQAKLLRKGCDLLVFNDVSDSAVFGRDDTSVTVFERAGERVREVFSAQGTKADVAEQVIEGVCSWLAR